MLSSSTHYVYEMSESQISLRGGGQLDLTNSLIHSLGWYFSVFCCWKADRRFQKFWVSRKGQYNIFFFRPYHVTGRNAPKCENVSLITQLFSLFFSQSKKPSKPKGDIRSLFMNAAKQKKKSEKDASVAGDELLGDILNEMHSEVNNLWPVFKTDSTTVKPALVTTCLQRPHFGFPLKMVSNWNMYWRNMSTKTTCL